MSPNPTAFPAPDAPKPASGLSKAARIRAAILGLAAISFVAGAAFTYLVTPSLRSAVAGVGEEPLGDRLGLDAAQREELAAILAAGEARLRSIQAEVQAAYRSRLDEVALETDREIGEKLRLTDEQRRRFEAWRAGGRSK